MNQLKLCLDAALISCLLSFSSIAHAAPAPLNIVQVLDQSGPNGDTGRDFVTGAQVYFDQLNSQGGINGRPVRMQRGDDGGLAHQTLALTRQLVAKHKPVALFGYLGADNVRAIQADPNLAQLPMLAPYLGISQGKADNAYYLRANLEAEIDKISRIAQASGLHKLALLSDNDSLGRAAASTIAAQLKVRQLTLQGQAILSEQDQAIDQAVSQLAKTSPQLIILAAPTIRSADFVRAYQAIRPGTQFFALSWINPRTLREFLGDQAVRSVAVSTMVPSPYNPTTAIAREFNAALKKYRDEAPCYASLEGYMAAKMLVENLRQASSGGPALRRALDQYQANWGGLQLSLRDGRRASRFVDVAVFSSDGRMLN